MKRLLISFYLAIVILQSFSGNAFAQPPQEEIDQLLGELGWEMADLTDYLAYYELSLTDFETIEDLQMVLGTPISPENLEALLREYEMTREELDVLLGGFGETLEEDYVFIEDLEVAINFYLEHDNLMMEFENFLSAIGITEEEADSLFNHLIALNQLELETEMEQVNARLKNLMMIDPEAELTEAQKAEIVTVWEGIMATVQLSPKFFLVNANGAETPMSFSDLVSMQDFTSNALLVELYDTQGTRILDLQVSEEMLGSQFAINAGEKLTGIGDLAGELTELKHGKLPDTASPYVVNMLIGFSILLAGICLFLYQNKRVNG